MKNLLFCFTALIFFAFVACEPASDTKENAPDYAAFERNVDILESFLQAHCDEDLALMRTMLSDTMRWHGAAWNDNQWLGKNEFLAAIEGYHNGFENIQYHSGIVMQDTTVNGFWSGSVYPQDMAQNGANNIRQYGHWTATHSETGTDIGVKWFALGTLNEEGKIVAWNEYFDVNGIAAQIEAATATEQEEQ
ncbi:MAG: hypothetical protein R3301_07305 [Saprospiraceae bacterium]|nr:hypothetical protein [Saprospiraceae bacterium]